MTSTNTSTLLRQLSLWCYFTWLYFTVCVYVCFLQLIVCCESVLVYGLTCNMQQHNRDKHSGNYFMGVCWRELTLAQFLSAQSASRWVRRTFWSHRASTGSKYFGTLDSSSGTSSECPTGGAVITLKHVVVVEAGGLMCGHLIFSQPPLTTLRCACARACACALTLILLPILFSCCSLWGNNR